MATSSVLWIALIAVWLLVVLPMVLRGRPEVKKTTAAAGSTRVLHRGGTATPQRRRSASRHPSNPDYVVKRSARSAAVRSGSQGSAEKKTSAAAKTAEEKVSAGKAAAEKTSAAKTAAEKSPVEKSATVTVQRVAPEKHQERDEEKSHGNEAAGASSNESGKTETNANEVTEVIDVVKAEQTPDPDSGEDRTDSTAPATAGEASAPGPVAESDDLETAEAAADEAEIDEADADDEPTAEDDGDELVDEDDDLDDEDFDDEGDLEDEAELVDEDEDEDFDDDEADDLVDDVEDEVVDKKPARAPKPVPRELRGRGGYGPDRPTERAQMRYRERQRVVGGLSLLTVIAIVLCFVWTIPGIVLTAIAVAMLATYLIFLRRTAIREAQFRAQRAARLKRQAEEDERLRRERQAPTYRPAPARLRRPGGAVVLEADDEDPAFDHLPTYDFSYAERVEVEGEYDREVYRTAG
ncbi:gephyrin-like molybdotransferase receptor GlpR [Gordonia sp. VNK21]|uniref:gephyrin-like molybdotransferase receptor GlpR n=1 Tax=Gordonia sp. VNK21 TaxID=3382483 RepID=UPI0038D474B8